jgi:putative ABC transport system substrate-binding protein
MLKRGSGFNKTGVALGFVLVLLLVIGGSAQVFAEIFTIGMITNVEIHAQTAEGFKAGMAEQGYVEGRDVQYIYNGVIPGGGKNLDAEIEHILAQDIDLFLTMANEVSLWVKKRLEGSDIPILIAASSRPVEGGILKSLGRPGGNITGVRVAESYAKALEWLTVIAPDAKKIFIPYNPDEAVSVVILEGLAASATGLGMEFVRHPVRSVEEAVAVIENLPKGMDAIYRIPSPTLDARNAELSRAAIIKGLPLVACLPLDDAVLMTFSTDLYEAGWQTARLAHLIRLGAKPSDLPVETCDAGLTINLKTAAELGLHISDEVLLQAKTILR